MTRTQCLGAVVIHGMGGIGKTSLAKAFYNDPLVCYHFSIRAWIQVPLQHCARDILLNLLKDEFSSFGQIEHINDEESANIVREKLGVGRYIVVVDCLCEINIGCWNYLKSILPDSNNGSRIILVNRWNFRDDEFVLSYHKKNFLGTGHSWELLRERVFGDELRTGKYKLRPALERIGKRIAKNCEGLPLAIITVGFHLARNEKTMEYWNKVADSGNSLAYAADGAPMFEQLRLSYTQLPQEFRPIFLYLAIFPEAGIFAVTLRNMWIAEGFMEQRQYKPFEDMTFEWINYFIAKNLIAEATIVILHHTMWHFCRNEAQNDEFFHVMNMQNDWEDFPPWMNINYVRRLVVSKNVLLGVKYIFQLKHSVISSVRSLLLSDQRHPYPLTINWSRYKMLRVVEARSIRLYEFPVGILSLALLCYLSLTLNRAEVPPEISRLRNLQFLLVFSFMKMISFGEAPSYLPMEIWGMPQLIHLQVKGSDLPVPPPQSGAMLPNLLTLFSVSPHSCTKEVLERIPNLRHLEIDINLALEIDVDAAPLSPFDHLVQLNQLICEISNPYYVGYPQPQLISMPETFRVSTSRLTSLVLHGCGLPWKSIKQLTRLPALTSLYLKHHAFRGPIWKLSNKRFKKLKYLMLEDLDLVYWTARSGEFFPCLVEFRITGCFKLQLIPSHFKRCHDLNFINVVNSSREVEIWAKSMHTHSLHKLDVGVYSPRAASIRNN